MDGFSITSSPFRKIRGDVAQEATLGRVHVVEATVKVTEAGYVPPEMIVRARIDARLLTGEFPTSALTRLDADPKVEAVSLGRRLRVVE